MRRGYTASESGRTDTVGVVTKRRNKKGRREAIASEEVFDQVVAKA